MTQDEIIRTAREAGFELGTAWYGNSKTLERFAAIVAAHEREACAKVCEELQTVNPAWVDMNYAEQCAAAIRSRNNAN